MMRTILILAAAVGVATSAQAQTYQIGQIVEANYGGPWLVCSVVKHNEKQGDYEVSCPSRTDTFRAEDDPSHIRPHAGGLPPVSPVAAARAADHAKIQPNVAALPLLGKAPARSTSNILLGRWKLTDGDCNSLILEFSPHLSRDYNKASGGYAAYWGQRAVESYVKSDNQVFVVVKNAGHSTVNVRDANHIVPDSMFQCTYTRM